MWCLHENLLETDFEQAYAVSVCTDCNVEILYLRESILLFLMRLCARQIAKCFLKKIKSSLYSRYYAEACNEWRGPSPQLSAWASQLRRNVAAVASRWRFCARFTGMGIEPQTSLTDSYVPIFLPSIFPL